jgi:hypothetical protein
MRTAALKRWRSFERDYRMATDHTDDELKVSPGLEDRLLDYAEKASETTGNHAAFVADMTEAAVLVAAVRNIIESRRAAF